MNSQSTKPEISTYQVNHMQVIIWKYYLGIYIPQTANQVVLNAAKRATDSLYPIKLVGVLIGNGVLSNDEKFRNEVADNYMVRRNFYDLITQTGILHQCTRYP